jgi:hypothetical protein
MPACSSSQEDLIAHSQFSADDSSQLWVGADQRTQDRSPFSFRLKLTPLDDLGAVELAEFDYEEFVTGKDLGKRGIGFFHEQPMPFRLVRLTAADERLNAMGLGDLQVEVVLKWCRFVSIGRYESGGRIARSAISTDFFPIGSANMPASVA